VSDERPVNFGRRDDITSLYRDSLRLWVAHLPLWLAVGATVAVPVDLIVAGFGLGRLDAPYTVPGPAALVVEAAASYVVATPLVTAMSAWALLELRRGRRPGVFAAIRAGVEAYPRMILPVLASAALVAAGVLALIVPGVYLAVLLYFVPQAVMVDGRSGLRAALGRSAQLVRGSWWRVLGIALITALVVLPLVLLVGRPFEAWAEASDQAAISLAGGIVVEVLTGPWVAIVATLLYLDLRERRPEGAR
jgi:hypothetical protein